MKSQLRMHSSLKVRYENFGGIIAHEKPPFLALVDRVFMRELGLAGSALWEGADETVGLLSAPTEVHLAATNACPVRCRHCYMGAGEKDAREMDTATFRRVLKRLAEWGVFHVALGGGEALARADLFELARYAREVGLVPNLTISGALLTPELAPRLRVFGQVNVSMDAVGPACGVFRGQDQFPRADQAIRLLVNAGVATGINCVVGRANFEHLPALFAYARERGVNEIEVLRLKPAGRAGPVYERERTTYEQNVALTPRLAELSAQHGVTAKIDCSFVPMLCAHRPPREWLEAMATYGCEAGNVLLGLGSDGAVSGCSFLPRMDLPVWDLPARWKTEPAFQRLRSWPQRAPEPCRSCPYLEICKGGCHAVAAHVCGDADAPDPDCPWVVEHRRQQETA